MLYPFFSRGVNGLQKENLKNKRSNSSPPHLFGKQTTITSISIMVKRISVILYIVDTVLSKILYQDFITSFESFYFLVPRRSHNTSKCRFIYVGKYFHFYLPGRKAKRKKKIEIKCWKTWKTWKMSLFSH